MTNPHTKNTRERGIRTLEEEMDRRCPECKGRRLDLKWLVRHGAATSCPTCHGTGKRQEAEERE